MEGNIFGVINKILAVFKYIRRLFVLVVFIFL